MESISARGRNRKNDTEVTPVSHSGRSRAALARASVGAFRVTAPNVSPGGQSMEARHIDSHPRADWHLNQVTHFKWS